MSSQVPGASPALRSQGRPLTRASHAYGLVLVLILASLVFQLAAADRGWARLVTIGLQSGTLIVALLVSGVHRWLLRLTLVVVAVAILASAGVLVGSGELGETGPRIILLLLVAVVPAAIVVGIVRETRLAGRVTIRTMFGVLCIYLLLGMVFAFAYGAIAAIDSREFFASGAAETQSNLVYFSFVTITTTGYGDLTAGTDLGRSLAVTEALSGQIYLVTAVALVVGNLALSRRNA